MASDKKEGFTKGVRNYPEKRGGKSQLLKVKAQKPLL